MKRQGLVPVIIQSKRRDPKTGKLTTFTKRVWVRPNEINKLKQRYGKKLRIPEEKEQLSFKPTLSQQEITKRLQPHLEFISRYTSAIYKQFKMFDFEDLHSQALLGAIEAIHKNPKIKNPKELRKKIKAFMLKSIRNYITENAETMGMAIKYNQKLERGERYEKVASIVPLLNEESEDETERIMGRKMLESIWKSISSLEATEEEQRKSFPYRVMFYKIAEKFLSPLELEAYKQVKIEGTSLRIVAGALGLSAVGVKKASERAEKKMANVLNLLAKTQVKNITPSDFKKEYQDLNLKSIDLNQFIILKATQEDVIPLINKVHEGKWNIIEEDGAYFLYDEKNELKSIYDSVYERFINVSI